MDNSKSLRYYEDDGPNYMLRTIAPVTPDDFHKNPDYYTERNERLEDSIGRENRRQAFHDIISAQDFDVKQIFKAIVNNRTKE
ncbi:MAG: hypothetical protein WCF91_01910 [bacterium]|jgi:hypothetical protein